MRRTQAGSLTNRPGRPFGVSKATTLPKVASSSASTASEAADTSIATGSSGPGGRSLLVCAKFMISLGFVRRGGRDDAP